MSDYNTISMTLTDPFARLPIEDADDKVMRNFLSSRWAEDWDSKEDSAHDN